MQLIFCGPILTAMDHLSWVALLVSLFLLDGTTAPTVHKPRECPCNGEDDYMNIWLDIIFIVDSTNSVGLDFANIKQLLLSMATYYRIGQELGKYSRIGIVNVGKEAVVVANLTKYTSGKEMQEDLSKNFHRLGGEVFYPQKGLQLAQKMLDEQERRGERLNVKKVVVLFTTKNIECDNEERLRMKRNDIAQISESGNDPCRLAAHMQSDGVIILTIAMRLPGNSVPYINIATPCFNTSNSENMVEDILKMLCMANCYCLPMYVQYVRTDDQCDRKGECIYANGISLSYSAAQKKCESERATLTDILDDDKQNFLNNLHSYTGLSPYWVGMKREDGKYVWDSLKQEAGNDYSNWGQGEPDVSKGDCVYLETNGFNLTWASDKCGTTTPAHFFSCQKVTCDSQNYCDY